MNKQHHLLLICGLFFVGALAVWLGFAAPRAYANVTLVDFKATSKAGVKEVYVYWETSTEMDTVGFFVTRKDTLDGSFDVVSEFIPHLDSSGLIGAQYYFTDTDSTLNLNQTYYYELEEITPNDPATHGPVTVTVGSSATVPPATNTPTATPTRTPTPTSSPTATTVSQSSTTSNTSSTTSSNSGVVATPRVVTGETITPLPTISSDSSKPVVIATQPARVLDAQQQPQTAATALPPVSDGAASGGAPPVSDRAAATAVPLPAAAAAVAQAEPTLAPADAAPAIAEPAIVVTEAAPTTAAPNSSNAPALLLVAAAFLFLGIAFVILRQVRQ
ncbi:MAG TPA: hypothetical protein VMP08_17885 [Anaerolineae bacterium]|nr:hypothetical protein [Anaerolineae bacterium]